MENKYKGIGIGIALGIAFGAAMNNIGIGIALGVAFAAAFGGFSQEDKSNSDNQDKDKEQ